LQQEKKKFKMNKLLFIIFVFTQFSCSPQKGNQKKAEIIVSEKPIGITEITFNEEIHDFGKLISGEIVVATFVFTNSGKHNLVENNLNQSKFMQIAKNQNI